ncbi:hypothetical protein D3C87_1400310 [compost metagenome]
MTNEELCLYGLLGLLFLLIIFSMAYYSRRFGSINMIVACIYILPMLYGYLHSQEYLMRNIWYNYMLVFSTSHIVSVLIFMLFKYLKNENLASILYKSSKLISILAAMWSVPFIIISGNEFLTKNSFGYIPYRSILFGIYELLCFLMYLFAIKRKYLPLGWIFLFLIIQIGAMAIFNKKYIALELVVMIVVFGLQIPKKREHRLVSI